MKRIMVIGCPGSGKSTFARALHQKTGIPLFYLDMMYWNADKTIVEKEIFLRRLTATVQKAQWIIDGNYGATMEMRLDHCDTVFFLDYPLEICLEGISSRRGKPRPDMPWVETEDDEEFLEFIRNFTTDNRPRIMELLQKYARKDIHIFKSREEADGFLEAL